MKCLKCKDTGKIPSVDMLICSEFCKCRVGERLRLKVAKIVDRVEIKAA